MSGWAFLIWTAVGVTAVLAAAAGGLLIAFAISGQRRQARIAHDGDSCGACDCCGYDLTGLEDGCCPECGWVYAGNRRVPLWRRVRAACAGAALLMIAGAGGVAREAWQNGAWSLVPNAVLIGAVPLAPAPGPGGVCSGPNSTGISAAIWRQLQARADAQRLAGWERRWLAARAAAAMRGGCAPVREAAAGLLMTLASEAGGVTDQLLVGLEDSSAKVRQMSVRGLARIAAADGRAGRQWAPLVHRLMGTALCDRDACVRRQALEFLNQFASRRSACGACVLPAGVAGVFARAASDPSPMVRALAIQAMGAGWRSVPPGADELSAATTAVRDRHSNVREAAAWTLGRLAESVDAAVVLLGLSLCDQAVEVRQTAAACLSRLGRRAAPAWPALLASLNDSDAVVRANAASAIAAIGSG